MSRRASKVLLVDDSEIIREAIAAILQGRGFEVVVLDSPAGLGRAMVLEKPDLVLMDVSMPTLSGDRLVEITLRSGLHVCPMVLFSDRPEPELAALAEDCGAAGYIRKGVDPDVLALQIRRFIQR